MYKNTSYYGLKLNSHARCYIRARFRASLELWPTILCCSLYEAVTGNRVAQSHSKKERKKAVSYPVNTYRHFYDDCYRSVIAIAKFAISDICSMTIDTTTS